MAEPVVDVLEVVEIEQHQGERHLVALGPPVLLDQPLLEVTAVGELGEGIGRGEPVQAAVLLGEPAQLLVRFQAPGDEEADLLFTGGDIERVGGAPLQRGDPVRRGVVFEEGEHRGGVVLPEGDRAEDLEHPRGRTIEDEQLALELGRGAERDGRRREPEVPQSGDPA
jgi:hypothetical protein